jgi:EAL domain-containing protein (putative c-di-GMP-specific phosphodiesterase class I)
MAIAFYKQDLAKPRNGLLPPSDFLPVIENSELENAVGEWVIGAALIQASEWHSKGLAFQVSINIAAGHLQSEGFLEGLSGKLADYPGLPLNSLQIEILETTALADIAKVSGIIESCREMGIGFALDDFGTGYSSLAYLRSLPAETLKIDQTFVRDMLTDDGDRAIIEGIIALAKAFNRETVAEGVETAQHYQALFAMGCQIAQGHAIARPMSAEKIPEWVKAWRPPEDWKG